MLPYPDIDPVAIELGPLRIHWYGISYVVGLLLAWWLLNRRAGRPGSGWTREQVADMLFYCAIGMIAGGRLGSVLFYNLPYYLDHPLAVFRIWEGGMSFHGGLIGVLIGMAVFGWHKGKRFFEVGDFLAPVAPVGLFCGRIGNFINGELWGRPTDLPWAMIFPHPAAGGIPRHPSQLYEALLEGVVLFVLLWWFSAGPRPRMAVSGLFLAGYGGFRFLVEFVREPDPQLGYLAWDWLTMGQLLSLPMLILGLWFLYLAYRGNEATAG
jgi:phosphatidylglycerol:prolipoprotein diacylglycerol transferase